MSSDEIDKAKILPNVDALLREYALPAMRTHASHFGQGDPTIVITFPDRYVAKAMRSYMSHLFNLPTFAEANNGISAMVSGTGKIVILSGPDAQACLQHATSDLEAANAGHVAELCGMEAMSEFIVRLRLIEEGQISATGQGAAIA